MQSKYMVDLQARRLRHVNQSSDSKQNNIIAPAIDSLGKITDANIDATCHLTHYGSNWVVCVDNIHVSTFN